MREPSAHWRCKEVLDLIGDAILVNEDIDMAAIEDGLMQALRYGDVASALNGGRRGVRVRALLKAHKAAKAKTRINELRKEAK